MARWRVMTVDDSAAILTIISAYLEDSEFEVVAAERDGIMAVERFAQERPDIVLLDLNMPKKDGRQALLEIKADPDLQRIPVAIWTTSDEVEDRIQCEIAGADVFVTKPVDYAELVDIVRGLVARYSSQRQPRLN